MTNSQPTYTKLLLTGVNFIPLLMLFACSSAKDKKLITAIKSEQDANAISNANGSQTSQEKKLLFSPVTIENGDLGYKIIPVTVSMDGFAPTTKWSLLYNLVNDGEKELHDGVAIASDLKISDKTVVWDLGNVVPGKYQLFASVNEKVNDGKIMVFRYQDVINIDQIVASAIKVVINSPKGSDSSYEKGTIFKVGDLVPINYEVSGGTAGKTKLKLEVSSDMGKTWELVADNLDVNGKDYDWKIASTAKTSANYKIRMIASEDGNISTGSSEKTFAIIQDEGKVVANFVAAMNSKCVSCHGNSGNFSASSFSDQGAIKGLVSDKNLIYDTTAPGSSKPMPPSGSTSLTAEEKDAIQIWLWSGAPTH